MLIHSVAYDKSATKQERKEAIKDAWAQYTAKFKHTYREELRQWDAEHPKKRGGKRAKSSARSDDEDDEDEGDDEDSGGDTEDAVGIPKVPYKDRMAALEEFEGKVTQLVRAFRA